MSSSNPKDPLHSVIFTDGHIEGLEHRGETATVTIVDYSGARLSLRFWGIERVRYDASVGPLGIMTAETIREGNTWHTRLDDDDGEPLLDLPTMPAPGRGPGHWTCPTPGRPGIAIRRTAPTNDSKAGAPTGSPSATYSGIRSSSTGSDTFTSRFTGPGNGSRYGSIQS